MYIKRCYCGLFRLNYFRLPSTVQNLFIYILESATIIICLLLLKFSKVPNSNIHVCTVFTFIQINKI